MKRHKPEDIVDKLRKGALDIKLPEPSRWLISMVALGPRDRYLADKSFRVAG